MRMEKEVVKLAKLEKEILLSLYRYRGLEIEQIARKHKIQKSYAYKRMSLLKRKGFVKSVVIHRNKGKYDGKYYGLTAKGLGFLKKSDIEGFAFSERIQQLDIQPLRVPYLLTINDIAIDLEDEGWIYEDSRAIKSRMGINNGDMIGGILSHDNQKYGVYAFMENSSEKNIARLVREVSDYASFKSGSVGITNFMIFKKGGFDLDELILALTEDRSLISRVSSLKLFPFDYGKQYLKVFCNDDRYVLENICELDEDFKLLRYLSPHEVNSKYPNLNCVISLLGEEMYFVNMFDNDLKKLAWVWDYHRDHYKADGREVLFALPDNMEIYQEMFLNYPHVSLLDLGELMGFKKSEEDDESEDEAEVEVE